MGREVRKVPADWEHPRDAQGHYYPLREPCSPEQRREDEEAFVKGLRRRYSFEPASPEWVRLWSAGCETYEEYAGPYRPEDHMDFGGRPATHLQMYETCTEGTPISPVMATAEELATWLAENRASAFGDMTAPREDWLRMIQGSGTAASMVIEGGVMLPGVGRS